MQQQNQWSHKSAVSSSSDCETLDLFAIRLRVSLGCCPYWLTLKIPNRPPQNRKAPQPKDFASNQTTPFPSSPKPWQHNREEGWKCKISTAEGLTVSVRAQISSTALQVVCSSGDIRGTSRAQKETSELRRASILPGTISVKQKTEKKLRELVDLLQAVTNIQS